MAINLKQVLKTAMKKINYIIIFLFAFTLNLSAQNNTKSSKSIVVCSLVSESEGGTVAKDAPLVMYLHDSLQSRRIAVVFTQRILKKMSYNPYNRLVNQPVCITGKLSEYNNEPAIVIQSERQIKTPSGAQVNKITAY